MNRLFAAAAILMVWGGCAFAERVVLPFTLTDSLENTWTIQKDGKLTVAEAPYHAYKDGGTSILSIDNDRFGNEQSAQRTIYDNGTEITIGPKAVGNVRVTRKIFLGNGEGHVRSLEIIENPTTSPVTCKVDLRNLVYSDNGYTLVWESDNAFVVDYKFSGIEFMCGPDGARKPKRNKADKTSIKHIWDSISIPPQSKVGILHFVSVRQRREQALEFAQSFQVTPACGNIDPADLACIINYDPRTLGAKTGIEVFRGGEKDLIQLKSGDQLTGIVANESIKIQTSYAQLNFPTSQIASVIFEGGASNIERIVALNGDVFSGFILDPSVDIQLDAGPKVTIRKEKISRLGFRIRGDEKQKYPVVHDITLTNGDHFSGKVKNTSLTIAASFGDMPVKIEQIARIEFISKKGTVTEITLKNGDKVSGFLKEEDIQIDLDFGGALSVYQDRVEKIIFDSAANSRILSEQAAEKESKEKG